MSKKHQMLHVTDLPLWLEGCPVLLCTHALLRNTRSGGLAVQCIFENLSEKTITEVRVSLSCVGANWFPALPVESFLYPKLSAAFRQTFGESVFIPLPDPGTREYSLSVAQVRFDDGSVWEGSGLPFHRIPDAPAVTLPEEFIPQYLRDMRAHCQTPRTGLPHRQEGWWRCACGAVVLGTPEVCPRCGSTYQSLLDAADPQLLSEHLKTYQIQTEKQKISNRQEAVRREVQLRVRRKRLVRTAIPCAILAVLTLCFTLFYYSVILPRNGYASASALLSQGEYKQAVSAFLELGDYRDAPEQAEQAEKEGNYQSALSLMESGRYEEAQAQFQLLRGYRDAREQEKKAKYHAGIKAQEEGELTEAKEIFTSLGMYEDSSQRLEKMETDEALQEIQKLIDEKRWNEAYYDIIILDPVYKQDSRVIELANQCLEACPLQIKTMLAPKYAHNYTDINYDYYTADDFTEEHGFLPTEQDVGDWEKLYLLVTASGELSLSYEFLQVEISWPDGKITTTEFYVYPNSEQLFYVLLDSNWEHPAGEVAIEITNGITGELIHTYTYHSNGRPQ